MGRGLSTVRQRQTNKSKRPRSASAIPSRSQSAKPVPVVAPEEDDDDMHMIAAPEESNESIIRQDVLNKYIEGGKIVDHVINVVQRACVEGANTKVLCALGDAEILAKLKQVFRHADKARAAQNRENSTGSTSTRRTPSGIAQDRANSTASRTASKAVERAASASRNPLAVTFNAGTTRGISFPTNISINETLCNHTPFTEEDSMNLKGGDVVKVHLGCHIDGYPVMSARTFTVPVVNAGAVADAAESEETPAAPTVVKGALPVSAYNAMEASRMALAGMAHMMKPGTETDDVTDFLHEVGYHYNVNPVEGVLSTRTKRWVPDAMQSIICRRVVNETPQQMVPPSVVDKLQVWTLDVAYTDSANYKMQIEARKINCCNIYRKNEVALYKAEDVRSESTNEFLNHDLKHKFHCFPFNPLHANEPLRVRLALHKLKQMSQIDGFPEMHCKRITSGHSARGLYQPITTRFSGTIAITNKKVIWLCGQPDVSSSIADRYASIPADLVASVQDPSELIQSVLVQPMTITDTKPSVAKKSRVELTVVETKKDEEVTEGGEKKLSAAAMMHPKFYTQRNKKAEE